MAVESFTVNGVDLRSLVTNVESLSGILRTAGRRGRNIEVPYRHGVIPTARKRYAAGEVEIPLWVKGINADGSPTADQVEAFYANVDTLIQAFHADTVVIDHTRPDGSTRRALCEMVEPLSFTRQPASPLFGRVTAVLTVPGAFWTELTAQTHTASLTDGQSTSATEFAGATAPMTDLLITFGAGNNPELGQGEAFLAYDGVIGTGQTLVVDTSKPNDPLSGSGGLTVDYSLLRHGGAAGLFEVWPSDPAPVLTLIHTTGVGVSMDVTVEGTRRYLTG